MLALKIYILFCMLAVMWFDAGRYIIPNWIVGSLLVVYPLAVWLAPVKILWMPAVAGMVGMFVLGYIVYMLKWMGAGDIKLLAVCSLWVGLMHLLDFIFAVALLGGALSVIVLVLRKALPYVPKKFTLPRILRDKEPIPYGLAIAAGFLWMAALGDIAVIAH